jgi:hypothetical protein
MSVVAHAPLGRISAGSLLVVAALAVALTQVRGPVSDGRWEHDAATPDDPLACRGDPPTAWTSSAARIIVGTSPGKVLTIIGGGPAASLPAQSADVAW